MKLASIKSLGERGFSHILLPIIVVAGVAAIGGLILIKSHADPVSPTATASTSPTSTRQLNELTKVIQQLNAGISANITVDPITVAGPVGDAQARPIVFVINKQTFFAYRQEVAPVFSTTARKTAASMAITSATGNPAVEQAHLDKANSLVDPDENSNLVGYSVAGDGSD